jgi:LacI family transcriptional regulator
VTSSDFEDRVNSLWGAAYRFNQDRLAAKNRIAPLIFKAEAELGALKQWLAATRPDAIVDALPNVFELLAELKLNVPRDLGFVHLDLPTHLRAADVCGIDQLWEIVGSGAIELIANQLYTNSIGLPKHPVTHLIEGAWVEGRTLAENASPIRVGRYD